MLPFNTRAKYEDTNNYKFQKKQDIEEIKRKVKKLKQAREKQKMEEEKRKEIEYAKHQNVMRKMHEDLMRDRGIYVAPGTSLNSGHLQTHGTMINSSAGINKRAQGYRVPRKFTLEALGRMDYRDFIPAPNTQEEEEFKPSDVLDSDEELDEEIMNLYQYRNKSLHDAHAYHTASQHVNSVVNLHHPSASVSTSQVLPSGISKRDHQKVMNHYIQSVPMSRENKKRLPNTGINKSVLPPQKRQNVMTEHRRYSVHKSSRTPAKKRNQSVIPHGAIAGTRSTKKSVSKLYPAKGLKTSKYPVSDYSPGRKRNASLRAANKKSLKRASEFDRKSKFNQEQKLKNILKMHNNKGIRMAKSKRHLL